MRYGAKYLQWAPFIETDAEPDTGLPKYGAALNIGELNLLSDSPAFNEVRAHGDDRLARFANEFRENPIDVEVLDILNSTMSAISGSKIDEGTGLKFNTGDSAPYGGLGFYSTGLDRDNKKTYQGIFYPKVKAAVQGESYSTKGDSITLSNQRLRFMGMASKAGDWKILSEPFDTESECKAWVDKMLKGSST